MAAKPTIALARFATGPGQDVTAPSSGLRDTGFVEGTPADQSYINELFNQSYQWALYLDEGDLVGDHEIDGDLAVTGSISGRHAGSIWMFGSDGVVDSGATLVLVGTEWRSVTSGGTQDVTFSVRLPAGSLITAITVNGVEGNAAGESYSASFYEVTAFGSVSQISTTKTSGTTGTGTSIGWTTADADFTPDGYEMTDLPHKLVVSIPQTSGAAEVRLLSVNIVLG